MNRSQPPLWTEAFWQAVDPVVLAAGYHRSEPDWISPRRHLVLSDFDLWYIRAGAGAVRLDGQWQDFAAGDLLVLKPGVLYQRERTVPGNPFQVYFAHLLPFGEAGERWNALLAEGWPQRLSLPHRPELRDLFQELFEAYTTRAAMPSLAVKGLALQILQVIFEELQQTPVPTTVVTPAGVLRARQVIERDYAQPLTLAALAGVANMSASHLSAEFRAVYGVPPIAYLLRVRVREAKLLLASGHAVRTVAEQVGFSSQHYFCRLFRQRTGLTPTRARHLRM